MKDIERITLADMMMDIFSGYVQGYIRICQDMLGYLNGISFLGYDFQSYPNSQKISLHILRYPFVSYHIPTYPKISSGANSQMQGQHHWLLGTATLKSVLLSAAVLMWKSVNFIQALGKNSLWRKRCSASLTCQEYFTFKISGYSV